MDVENVEHSKKRMKFDNKQRKRGNKPGLKARKQSNRVKEEVETAHKRMKHFENIKEHQDKQQEIKEKWYSEESLKYVNTSKRAITKRDIRRAAAGMTHNTPLRIEGK
jgi:hypothetical protein